jgi:hypothetical protein
LLYELP